jgi:splicing factor U2AF subunit
LKVRRPKDYVPTAGEEHIADPTVPNSDGSTGPVANIVSTNVEDTPNKIFIGGIPPNLNEADVRELLQVFGALKSFNLVRDTTTGASKGYAFCEYLDPNTTDNACKGLNGMKIVDKNLVVQRASVGSKNSMTMTVGGKIREPTNIAAASLMNLVTPLPTLLKAIIKDAKPVEPTKILVLLNCVNVDDFPQGDAYNDMIEDIKEECKKHGRVRSVVIPQPPPKPQAQLIDGQMIIPQAPEQTGEEDPLEPKVPGLGKIFIEFSKVEDARRAQVALGGRRYDGRLIITTFFDEEKFKAGERRVNLAHLVGEQSAEDLQILQRQQQQFAMAAMHNTFVKGDDYHA